MWNLPYSARALLALVAGLFSGVFFAAIATVVILFQGIDGITYMQAMNVYLVGGLAAGILLAVLHPIMRYRLGALVAGAIAYAPMTVGFMMSLHGRLSEWTLENVLAGIPVTIAIGGGFGAGVWEMSNKVAPEDNGSE